ncbi:MAG: homoserine kinase [Pseudomonadota bacterium]
MAVYTTVPADALAAFLADYDLGALVRHDGVAQGVENTNYIVETARRRFILTLFEKRVDPADLPFFVAFMAHVAAAGIAAPEPIADRRGRALKTLCDRPALATTFLNGAGVAGTPSPHEARAVGAVSARLHRAAETFARSRENALGPAGWARLAAACGADAETCAPGLARLIADELAAVRGAWPTGLPRGVVHADLFPDNVFFDGEACTGVIDFYFSCTDFFAYDLAITLNAWCGEGGWSAERARALMDGYEAVRPLAPDERAALPVLLRGAALRFLLTRAYDWLHRTDGATLTVKDPLVYRDLLDFLRRGAPPGLQG